MSINIDVKKYCRDEAIWAGENHNEGFYNCSQLVKTQNVWNELERNCDMKSNCKISTSNLLINNEKTSPTGVCGDEAFFFA